MNRSISEPSIEATNANPEMQLVIFTLAACELGVEIHRVREIIRVSELAMMPKAPRFLEGIINLRGRIIPVLDLKKRFEMPLLEKTGETRILVVEIKDQILGLLVDKVAEVLKILPESINQASGPVLNIGAEFIDGLVPIKDRLIILFKLEKIFKLEELKGVPELETNFNGEEKTLGH
jgi:purine-binding chemotaxis protein CheW